MISAILLAAGQSKRMNGENKLVKKYNAKYLINHILSVLIKSKVDKVIIVLGFQNLKVRKIILKSRKINLVINKKYKTGMASSIKIGLKKLSKQNIGFFIVQADMPLVSKKTINKLYYVLKKKDKKIVVPINKNKIGNPVGFKISMKGVLNKTKGDKGAKTMIKKNIEKVSLVKINSRSILEDFNTQKDFLVN